jgi:hypothetical protein
VMRITPANDRHRRAVVPKYNYTTRQEHEMNQPTARHQFASDYVMVTDNNQEAYREALDIVREANGSVAKASEKFREQFESYISDVVEREREHGNEIGASLIAEMLIGFGSDAFDDIARHYIDTDLEHRLVERLTSVLKTGN